MTYCKGYSANLTVAEIEGKAWHDQDMYMVKCNKCGAVDTCLARRPNQVIIKCEGGHQ